MIKMFLTIAESQSRGLLQPAYDNHQGYIPPVGNRRIEETASLLNNRGVVINQKATPGVTGF